MTHDTDSDWEVWGKNDPYFGVCTQAQYRRNQMTEESREEFFQAGEERMAAILEYCRRHIDPDFRPRRALDFGCGVGRLLLPTARIAEHVTGVDVSESMLAEAKANCLERGLTHVTLLKSDDDLSLVADKYDFVYSHIVIQHIPVERGTRIIDRLVALLEPGGIGYLQVTYGREDCPQTYGVPASPEPPPVGRRVADGLKAPLRLLKRGVKALLGRPTPPPPEPDMQMNPYDLNQLLFILQRSGVTDVHVTFTNHGGALGVALHFRKP